MRVNQEVIENEVLQVFVDYRIPAGGRLMFSDLREVWPGSNLRQGDLIEGLKHLVFNGLLDLEDEAAGPMLVLTLAGYVRAHNLPSRTRSSLRTFLGDTVFSLKRRRNGTGRRVTDPAMQAQA